MTASKREERIKAISTDILSAFKEGRVPEAVGQVFIRRKVSVPSKDWSWMNRLVGMLHGHAYAAGYRQWQMFGRSVRKGERAFHILGPRTVKVKPEEDEAEDGNPCDEEPRRKVVGYVAISVFGYLQTEGKPLPGLEEEPAFLDGLPLVEVARRWDLAVEALSFGDLPGILGQYHRGSGIQLATRNLSTWAHELVHAADDRLGSLGDEKLASEVVAELGGAILLETLGFKAESDRGGCFKYVSAYCRRYKRPLLSTVTSLLDRTCRCVSLLLDEAELVAEEKGVACGASR